MHNDALYMCCSLHKEVRACNVSHTDKQYWTYRGTYSNIYVIMKFLDN